MAKYTNPKAGTTVSIPHKSSVIRIAGLETVEVPAGVNVDVYVKRGKLVLVEEKKTEAKKPDKPAAETKPANNQSQ